MSVDFAELKTRFPIERVAREMLNLKLSGSGDQLRGPCPISKSSDPRSFVITISKQAFYSFKARQGGDMLTLVALTNECDVRKAAEMIATHFGVAATTSPHTSSPHSQPSPARKHPFDAERYASALDAEHDALNGLGLASETLKTWKAGYAPSGVLRGRLALPVASKDGTVVGYVGQTLKGETPALLIPNGLSPQDYIFGADRVARGELFLVREPLDVLKAFEGGVENCVSFLTEGITSAQLQYLSALMDQQKIDTLSLF